MLYLESMEFTIQPIAQYSFLDIVLMAYDGHSLSAKVNGRFAS